MKTNGPNTTPYSTDFQIKTSPFTTALCLQSVAHVSVQLNMSTLMPWAFNLSNTMCCVESFLNKSK